METLFTELTLSEQASVSGGYYTGDVEASLGIFAKAKTENTSKIYQKASVKGDYDSTNQSASVSQIGQAIQAGNAALNSSY